MVEETIHRQGRGEMKYEVFQELNTLEKEVALRPISEVDKRKLRSFITAIKQRLEKL
tara:strand:+ start:94 stop:264 length:171 start_codon:yes stop_codon:yes gene_type:complete